MQHATPSCQLHASDTGDSSAISLHASDTQCPHTGTTEPHVRKPQQEAATTSSRRSGPRRWLVAVRWLIDAGYRGLNATTLRVAEDLAARMDYDLGHVLYCAEETATRLGLSLRSLYRHVRSLRELGALVWIQHGSRLNIRRRNNLSGYAGTATVYGAAIPPIFDHAMGHRIVGEGYEARIIVDYRKPIPAPRNPVDNPPVDNPGTGGRVTPSLTSANQEGKLKMMGGVNYTPQAAREGQSPTQSSKNNRSSGTRRSPLKVAQDIRTAAQVRPLVNWTQREGLRRLAYALRPLIDRGLDAYGIAEYLHGMCSGLRWRPRNPAAYISTTLTEQSKQAAEQAEAAARWERENPLEGSFTGSLAARMDVMAGLRQGIARYEQTARAHGWDNLATTADTHTWNAEADILAFLNGSPA